MKKLLIAISIVVVIILAVLIYFYVSRPDLVILSVTRDRTVDSSLCKYNLEIKNKGFAPINSIVSFCYWPENSSKCRFAWDVIARNSDTGITTPININNGERYTFNMVADPRDRFGAECPKVLHFCIDCNLHRVYDKEVIDGSIKESIEFNNEYTYEETN